MGDGALWSDRHISISLFGFPLQLLCPALPLFALSVGRRWLVPLNRPPPPLFSAFLLRVFLSVGCFCMGCLHPTCPSCGRVLCAIGLCWCVSAVLLAVSRISCCFFRPRLCALLARRAAFLLCPRRGLWPYYNSPPSSGRALMRYWPVLLHSSLVLGMAFGHYSCLSLLLRAAPPCALRLSCCVPPLSSAPLAINPAWPFPGWRQCRRPSIPEHHRAYRFPFQAAL